MTEGSRAQTLELHFAFASASSAGAAVNGRPTNGTLEWKVEGSGKNYKDWEAERLEAEG